MRLGAEHERADVQRRSIRGRHPRPVGLRQQRAGQLERTFWQHRDGEAGGAPAEPGVVDLTDDAATRTAVTRLAERAGHLDVVHFNPSAYREKDPLSLTPDELLEDVRLGVGALLTLVQAARPFLGPGGRITATGSMAADTPWFGAASLGVQKAGLQNLVRSIDNTLKGDGIRAVSVTVRGMLAKEGAFAPDNVARALRAAADQDESAWRSEIAYPA